MKAITVIFAIIMAISLINIIDAYQSKRYSNDLFQRRLLDLLLEAKQRGLLPDESKQSDEDTQQERRADRFVDEDHHQRTNVRRKVVGLGDNPF